MITVTERVSFPNKEGQMLAGRLDRPSEDPLATALLAHCFTCSKELKAINWIAKDLTERGIAVLRFDFAGLGESEGHFAETHFSSNLDDLESAADYLRGMHQPPAMVIGHSLGGTAALAGAERIAECRMVATIASPAETHHIRDKLLRDEPDIMEQGQKEVSFGGRKVLIKKEFLEDLERHDVSAKTAQLKRALLVFHSTQDAVVPMEQAYRIFQSAGEPKSLISLDGADHLLLREEKYAGYIAEVIAAWAHCHL